MGSGSVAGQVSEVMGDLTVLLLSSAAYPIP